MEGGSSGSINAGILEVDPDLRDWTATSSAACCVIAVGLVLLFGRLDWLYAFMPTFGE
jgi:type IV secretory pathway VirB2 component (pilin)